MFDSKYSNLIWEFILPLWMILIVMVTIALSVYEFMQTNEDRYFQTKYEFVTQDGEIKEGYGCKTNNGEGICIGDDGTNYFGVKSYKEIPIQKEYYLDGYYLVIITCNDNYKDLDFETLKTHFKSNYNAKSILIDDGGVAGTEIFCEKAEIDNIKQQLESDYLVQGYEILEFKRSDDND